MGSRILSFVIVALLAGILVALVTIQPADAGNRAQKVTQQGLRYSWGDITSVTCGNAGTTAITIPAGRHTFQVVGEAVFIDDNTSAVLGTDRTFLDGYIAVHDEAASETAFCGSTDGAGIIYLIPMGS